MPERLNDVLKEDKAVLHTFPVVLKENESDGCPPEEDFKKKALEAAALARLVPDTELKKLTTRVHAGRGGPLRPYGDRHGILAETPAGLEQFVRENAYFLWQQEGYPEGRAEEHWHRAHEQHIRERAYILWHQEGCPEGRAEEHWYRVKNFETP